MNIKKRWIILMTAMTLIAVAGLAVGEPTFEEHIREKNK